jgi:large subunit ribosomal protein L10
MSKVIKRMEMDALKHLFRDVRDLVVLSVKGLNCQAEHTLRSSLRKKKINLKVVKNSLTRKVFSELGIGLGDDAPFWVGQTTMAWGAGSIAELSRELDGELKQPKMAPVYKDKVSIKGAIADGQAIPFEKAKTMPTRAEAIARVITLALSPGARLVGQILGPASRVAGQINTVRDREGEPAPAPA